MSGTSTSLDWPDGFERTPPADREPYPHNFRVDRRDAFRNIVQELDRMGVTDVEIDSAASHGETESNIPSRDADPDDPGVVARFRRDGDRFAVPCDRWDSLRDNAQAIAKYLNAKRALDRYGVETVEDEMSTGLVARADR